MNWKLICLDALNRVLIVQVFQQKFSCWFFSLFKLEFFRCLSPDIFNKCLHEKLWTSKEVFLLYIFWFYSVRRKRDWTEMRNCATCFEKRIFSNFYLSWRKFSILWPRFQFKTSYLRKTIQLIKRSIRSLRWSPTSPERPSKVFSLWISRYSISYLPRTEC